MPLLIKNGYLVTLDDHNTFLEKGDLLVRCDTIEAIGPDLPAPEEELCDVIDAKGMLVMPGLVNCHIHSGERLLRGMTAALPNEIWNLFVYPPIGHAFDIAPRLFYLLTMVSMIECVKGGVTAIHDQSRDWHISPYPGASQAYFSAYDQIGVRAELAISIVDKSWHETITNLTDYLPPELLAKMLKGDDESHWKLDSLEYAAETCATYVDRWHGYDNRFTVAINPSAPQRCTDAMLVHLRQLAEQYGLSYHLHLLETRMQRAMNRRPPYNGSVVRYLDNLGLLDERTSLAHAIWLTDEEIDVLSRTGVSVIHNPACNQFMGSGVMPLIKYIRKNIPVAIATDGVAGNGNMSMFESIKMAALVHNTTTPDFSQWIKPEQILRMATQGSARCMGLAEQIGMLKPGMKADIILLRRNTVSFSPLYDVYNQLVYAEDGSSVDTVIVGGRVIMKDRQLKNVDEQAILREIQTYRQALAAFREQALTSSREIHPVLDKVYKQILEEG